MVCNIKQIENFLLKVDSSFPIPLSEKQNLSEFSHKLYNQSVICAEMINDKIVSMVAGYVNDQVENHGYISIVATLPDYQRQGLSQKLIGNFLKIANFEGMKLVHLYTRETNISAIKMYEKIGFQICNNKNFERKGDVHFVFKFVGDKYMKDAVK